MAEARNRSKRDGRLPRATDDLAVVSPAASRDAGALTADLLGDFLPRLAAAASSGRRLDRVALEAVGASGRRARAGDPGRPGG